MLLQLLFRNRNPIFSYNGIASTALFEVAFAITLSGKHFIESLFINSNRAVVFM